MSRFSRWTGLILSALAPYICLLTPSAGAAEPSPFEDLFEERRKSVVAVEFFVETETDRRPSAVVGMVIDGKGTIMLLDSAIPGWLPPDQLKDFQVYVPGSRKGVPGRYLGQDHLTGWHFIRAPEELAADLVPFTAYEIDIPRVGTEAWGIGLMGKDFDFQPYLMVGRTALIQKMPQEIAFSISDLASPGSPVFSREGGFLGWAGNAIPQERLLFLENDRYNVGIQNPNGTGSFMLAAEVLPYINRVPEAVTGQPVPWLGVVGLQPVEHEAAEFLKIDNKSAVLISDIIKDGPADKAGLKKRDIILTLNGAEFPPFSPDRVVTNYFEREILKRAPGDVMRLGILRGADEHLDIDVTLGQQPTPLKEARRQYFGRLGITLREFVLFDRISRRLTDTDEKGVVANFVKPNSPANTAGLLAGDLIQEIDGKVVDRYEQALALMQAIEDDESRNEFVLLISRGTETSVIRVRLK